MRDLVSTTKRYYGIDEVDRSLRSKKELKESKHSSQEWILLLLYSIVKESDGKITEIMNKAFQAYHSVLSRNNLDLGFGFRWEKKGVWSDEIYNIIDDLTFVNHVERRIDAGKEINLRLTEKGMQYLEKTLSESDFKIASDIVNQNSELDHAILYGSFLHHIYDSYSHHLSRINVVDTDPDAFLTQMELEHSLISLRGTNVPRGRAMYRSVDEFQQHQKQEMSENHEDTTDILNWIKDEPNSYTYRTDEIIGRYFSQSNLTDEWFYWVFRTPLTFSPFVGLDDLRSEKAPEIERNLFELDKKDTCVYLAATSPFLAQGVSIITMTRRLPLLVPVYNVSASSAMFPSLTSGHHFVDLLSRDLAGVTNIKSRFDGTDIYGSCILRKKPLTISHIPEDNLFGIPADRLKSNDFTIDVYHGGYWLLLREDLFSPGDHVLDFSAKSRHREIGNRLIIRTLV
jgi:hypothetical protein